MYRKRESARRVITPLKSTPMIGVTIAQWPMKVIVKLLKSINLLEERKKPRIVSYFLCETFSSRLNWDSL